MTVEDIEKIIAQGEGTSIEFKKAKEKVPQSLYETVVSFANTRGGYILLGVDDDGTVWGIQPESKADFLKNIATALNSKDNINPVMYLNPSAIDCKGKTVIAIQVPASSQVHDHAGKIYIREYETDLDVTGNQHTISGLYLKKRTIYTETHIYPGLKMSDMNEPLFEKARNLIYSNRTDHPWLSVDNMQMLRDAVLYWNDYENNREGFSLAAALIFGKDLTIQNLLPAYKVEAMVRIKNKDRWDDRLTLRTNLIDTYLQLKEFINRHLPDKFYMEGDQRIDLRDKVFREVIGNIICHREYTDGIATELIIEEDAVRTLNPNNPYFYGIMDLNNFNPHPKNPNIRKFFTALGWADEIGSGIRNTQKYLPRYVENAAPVFIDEPLFRTIIPLTRTTLGSDKASAFIEFVGLQREKLNEETILAIENLELAFDLAKIKNLDELLYKLGGSWSERGGKFKKLRLQINSDLEFDEFQKGGSWNKKGGKFMSKRTLNIFQLLLIALCPKNASEIQEITGFLDREKQRELYIKPLRDAGLLEHTIKDKLNSPNQKYVITEQGKRFLTGRDD
ncbi:MAG: putative DNA binding domain-containing protein [Prevotellaceae bacterium]|jgi:ATP-dependent DNA helicase RecG|nr:putative DNA binding domain-containing protein [Prevotellaceae bacterium]